jgi:purine-cytosine permease-like protein
MMKRNFLVLSMLLVIIIAFVVVIFGISYLTPKAEYTIVVCGTQIVYGGEIIYSTNETTTTIRNASFFAQGTFTSTFETNVSTSETLGYSTSFTDLGVCTYTSLTSS